MNYKKEEAASLMKKLGVELKPEDREKDGKQLLKVSLITQLFKGYFLSLPIMDIHNILVTLLCAVKDNVNGSPYSE